MKDNFVEYKWNLATSVDGTHLVCLVWDIGPASMLEAVGFSNVISLSFLQISDGINVQ